MTPSLAHVVGWTITDHDGPEVPTVVTAVLQRSETLYFETAAGWSFGGQIRYMALSVREDHVEVWIQGGLRATISRPGAIR